MIRSHIDRTMGVVLGFTSLCGALAACSAESTEPPGSSAGGSSSVAGTSAGSGTSAGGSAGVGVGTSGAGPGTSGATTGGTTATGTAGSGGAGPVMPLCTTKLTAQTPAIADFESYDGVLAPADYRWIFGGAAAGQLGVNAGTYVFGDETATPTLALLAGHGGNYGLTVSVTNASAWGMGFGFYMLDQNYSAACLDASAYKGVSMWVRGSVPTGTFSFSLSMSQATLPSSTGPGGSCTGTDDTTCKSPTATGLPISMTWSQVDVLWADLVGGLSGPGVPLAANGDHITGFGFSANLNFMPESEGSTTYVPVPGDITVVVDDIAFIP